MTSERGSLTCNKVAMLLLNAIYCLLGVGVGCIGLWMLSGSSWTVLHSLTAAVPLYRADNQAIPAQSLDYIPTLQQLALGMASVGLCVVLVSILGCYASLKESKGALVSYVTLVVVVLAVQMFLGGLAVVYQGRAVSGLVSAMRNRLHAHYGAHQHQHFTNALDYVQYQLQCCGVLNHTDWRNSRWAVERIGGRLRGVERLVPKTCCVLRPSFHPHLNPDPFDEEKCQKDNPSEHRGARHSQGCLERVTMWVRTESSIIICCGIGVGLLQIAGLVAALSLCKSTRKLPVR